MVNAIFQDKERSPVLQAQDSALVMVVLTTPDDAPIWLNALCQLFHVSTALSDTNIADAITRQAPDALVVDESCPRCPDVLAAAMQCANKPALVLVADIDSSGDCDHLADVIAAPDAHLLPRQLRNALLMRAAREEIKAQLLQAQDRAARADARLDESRRSAQELELLKNAIVNNVSHELKTPLLHVKAAVALLAEDAVNPKLVEYATGATARLEALVRNITQLAGSQDLSIGPILIRECVSYAIANLGRTWEHKDAVGRIRVQIDERLPPVLGDRQGISVVLQLLMDNALKFSSDLVVVEAHRIKNTVRISVSDHGIGIAPDQRERIFESFYQINSSSTRPYGGAGIGLAIVRLILDRHGVSIELDSAVGKGSVFAFALPVAPLD